MALDPVLGWAVCLLPPLVYGVLITVQRRRAVKVIGSLRAELAEARHSMELLTMEPLRGQLTSIGPPVVDVKLPTDMTGEEVALYLGVTKRTVQRWTHVDGTIPVRGVLRGSRGFLYDAAAVKALAASRSWVCADTAAMAATFGETSGRAEDAEDG